ncbi:hypothetical protein K443DRAFT_99692 [Laccaria amethystina LaAM-08-1]|uniref:Kinesin light chain n=1 Tax=Laccaria amethystina LaAM-08-1 TaxID=1095629 RepID=A0A0C9X6U3_9AGAR|nr:hypothetical protein K443DRAFT_99692 [Laccaria amethystina LaAM-08-1]
METLKGIGQSCGLDGSPESALKWIGSLKENYVLIFDNADVLSPAALEVYFPRGMRGNILITSRNSAMMSLTSPESSLEVTEMKEGDAIGLLLKASCLKSPTSDVQIEASKIVKKLFCFPLAIDQAGAYIASGATTIGDYLAKYSEHRKTLLSHSEFTGASKYNRTGITEEIFSYAALEKDDTTPMSNLPLASSLLDRRLLPLHEKGTWDNFIFREGIRILLSFSLIKRGPSDDVYAMHPLVHTWGRDRLTLNERKKCCLMVYVTLSCSLRWDVGQPYGFWRTLVTHVRANMEYFKSEGNQNIISYTDDAYEKFGWLLRVQGYSKEAEALQTEVLDKRNKILGAEHPHTIFAMASLASTNGNLGKYTEAEKLELQVLDKRNRIFGMEHPDTILAMADLAATYKNLGKYNDAEKLEIQVLEKRNRILGVEHLDTILSIGNLAATNSKLGKYKEAKKLEIQVLNARKRILGVEHPDTILAMANLATGYTNAEKLGIQVLNARERILGVEHPDTILAMANLAFEYSSVGKYKEAEKLEIQVLEKRNRILGVEHPDTIFSMGNLAATIRDLGRYKEAEKLEIQVLNARKRILGVEHPDTIYAMANLAETNSNMGKYKEAEKLEIQVLDARKRILGVEHPNTIQAMEKLAVTLICLGKYEEAQKLVIQAQEVKSTVLGAESHYISATVSNV